MDELTEELSFLGFELSNLGKGAFSINGIPADCKESDAEKYLKELLSSFNEGASLKENRKEQMALKLAETSAIKAGKILTEDEMMNLVSQLFSLPSPDYTIDNRMVLTFITQEEIEKKFK